MEGTAFGPYVLIEELGRGAMGAVYRARHLALDRECAIKVMRPELASSRTAERFVQEGQAVGKLGKHPNVVQVFDAGRVEGQPYMAMELVDGDELHQMIMAADRGELRERRGDIRRGAGHGGARGGAPLRNR